MTRTQASRLAAMQRLADQAEAVADGLHAQLDAVKDLCDALLLHIEDLGGDRAHNWDLQAELGYAQTALYAAAQRARTVARHARSGPS